MCSKDPIGIRVDMEKGEKEIRGVIERERERERERETERERQRERGICSVYKEMIKKINRVERVRERDGDEDRGSEIYR